MCRQSFRSAEELAAHMAHHNTGSSTDEMYACVEPSETLGGDLVGIVKEEPNDESDEETIESYSEEYNDEMVVEEKQKNF